MTFRGLQRWRDTDGVRRGFLSMDLTATGWEGHEFAWIKGIDFVRGIVLLFFTISSKGDEASMPLLYGISLLEIVNASGS